MDFIEDRLLKVDDCLKIIPVAKSTWWAQVAAGVFPAPVKINTSTFWRHSDLMSYIATMETIKGRPACL